MPALRCQVPHIGKVGVGGTVSGQGVDEKNWQNWHCLLTDIQLKAQTLLDKQMDKCLIKQL